MDEMCSQEKALRLLGQALKNGQVKPEETLAIGRVIRSSDLSEGTLDDPEVYATLSEQLMEIEGLSK